MLKYAMNFRYILPWAFVFTLLLTGHFTAAIVIAALIVICS